MRARRRRDGQPVVVKIMHPDTLSDSAREEARQCKGLSSNTLALKNLTLLACGVVCMGALRSAPHIHMSRLAGRQTSTVFEDEHKICPRQCIALTVREGCHSITSGTENTGAE